MEATSSRPCSQSKIITFRSNFDNGFPRSRSTSLHDNVFSFLLLEDFDLEAGLEAEPVASEAPVALLVPPDIEVTPN